MAALEELKFLADKIREVDGLKDAQLYGEICYKIAQRAFKINERIGKFLDKL